MPAPIVFPPSSRPGQKPGEAQGRLINAYLEVDGDTKRWRPVPGLVAFTDTAQSTPRGFMEVNGLLYAAFEGKLVTVTSGGVVTVLSGALDGALPVTMAQNNKAPTPDVVIVTENGPFIASGGSVASYPDSDVGSPNSVSGLGGYFLFTYGSGQITASDLNTTAINSLSTAEAESRPDSLIRGVVKGQRFYAFGTSTTEVWSDRGTSPFPLGRDDVLEFGLLSFSAVAGFEEGWDRPMLFVASDRSVRRLDGYQAVPVSTPDVQRAIENADPESLRASVHVVAGNPMWTLSSDEWTWEFNLTTGQWHERQSYGLMAWRGEQSIKFAGRWLVGDTESGKLLEVRDGEREEDGTVLVATFQAAPNRGFPARARIPSAFFDFVVGQGEAAGRSPIETDPEVLVDWSMDGGASFGNAVRHSLGRQGEYRTLVRQNRAGTASHHGVTFRLRVSSPVYVALHGGYLESELRRP